MIKKHLDLVIVGFLMLAIVMYDITLEILAEVLEVILEVAHTMFEWVELGVEIAVEHVFHFLHIGNAVAYLFITERHASQVFTFYIMMSMLGFGLFKISKFVPGIYEKLKQLILVAWVRRKTQFQLYWGSLTLFHKATLAATALGVAYLASFFVI